MNTRVCLNNGKENISNISHVFFNNSCTPGVITDHGLNIIVRSSEFLLDVRTEKGKNYFNIRSE
jgi:hypothetical protein